MSLLTAKLSQWFLGDLSSAQIPSRIRQSIEQQQDTSEILIGWIQLGILTILAGLYIVSPKTFTEEADFAPVPWALTAYFIFTVTRLVFSRRGRLPHWFLVLSIIVDMALLMGLIWSFHLQYEQPASFYLKAPSLLYVFIFIALRALRFEPGYVFLSGVIAATGWLLMMWYAISIEPTDPMITKNYVEYMTSNSVLLGAEFDKVISILLVTTVLTLAIARARRLLVRSVIEHSTAEDLSRFVPSAVAAQIATSEQRAEAGQSKVAEATILFIDIEAFTAIGESLAPQALVDTLNDYFAEVTEPIERHGGTVCQFQGDAILASFNLPTEHSEHAYNAVAAAVEIQQRLSQRTFGHGTQLRARIGINTGTVVGGLVGSPDRLGYTIHGDDVNLAARLEQLNKKHGTRIMVSQRTRELAGPGRFPFHPIGEATVRGKSVAVTTYAVSVDSNAS
ncbi:MAG: adenylate/guanylate cyclase domain-containing protein [Gammaproteobacteria bacterium]|nr:adenylate/guanylate cyclase domain-containing protein [Gammaproteobacteria bacterium]